MATLDDKKQQYIADVRQWVRDYQQMMERAGPLTANWPLYQALISDNDIPDSVIPEPDKITSFTDAIANAITIKANFDVGIDDNFERVA